MLQVFTPKPGKYRHGWNLDNVLKNSTYSYTDTDTHLLISDSPTELANAFSMSVVTGNSISSKDKIFFTKTCGYPSLLFSKLKEGGYNLDISRTVQVNKANKIVFKLNPIVARYSSTYLTTLNENGAQRISFCIPNLTDTQVLANMKSQAEKHVGRTFYYAKEIEDYETVESYLNNKSKAITAIDLIKYTNTFLPPMSDLELDMAITYLKSSDEQARKLGIEMFQYNNLSNQLYNVIKKIKTEVPRHYIPHYSEGSVAWKYLYTILQLSDSDLRDVNFSKCFGHFLKLIMNNPLNTSNLDELRDSIKQQIMDRLLNDSEFKEFREDLELINCELTIHDKNGETATGD